MKTTLYIQIINTDDSGEYDYNGRMTNKEWADAMCEHISKAEEYVNPWANNMEEYQYMMSQARNDREREYITQKYSSMLQMGRRRNGLVEDYHEIETVGYDEGFGHRAQDVECICEVTDADENDVSIDFFREHANEMFVLCLNIRPTDDDIEKKDNLQDNIYNDKVKQEYIPWEDAEGEIRFWMKDSRGIIDDKTFNDDIKLKSLPPKRLRFKIGNELYAASCCKIIDIRDNKYEPYKFVILGDKMERI